MPFMLELFTHPGCMSRQDGSQLILDALKDFPQVSFREVNMVANCKRTSSLGVKMSPTLVFNDKIITVGIPRTEELKALLQKAIKESTHVS